MNDMVRFRLAASLKHWEGQRNDLYFVNGIPHIGIGHNLRTSISDLAVETIFRDDVRGVGDAVDRALPWSAALALPRVAVLYEMAFNLGLGGLLRFQQMLAACQEENWELAAVEILDSDAATQTGGARYRMFAEQMRRGEWQDPAVDL